MGSVTNMSSKIDANIGNEQSRFREGMTAKCFSELVARRGIRWEVNLPPGGKEVRKKGRKGERSKGRDILIFIK